MAKMWSVGVVYTDRNPAHFFQRSRPHFSNQNPWFLISMMETIMVSIMETIMEDVNGSQKHIWLVSKPRKLEHFLDIT